MTIKQMIKMRDDALKAAVIKDDFSQIYVYSIMLSIKIPKDEKVFKAGIYKAACECLNLSPEIRKKAAEKCIELGFKPGIKE